MPRTRLLSLAASSILLAACRPSVPATQGAESAAIAVDSVSATIAGPPAADFKSIAAKVVRQSANVTKGEVVEIAGSPEDLPLLEDIAIETRKVGAFPLVLVSSEQYSRRSYDEVPPELDSQPPTGPLKLVGVMDVFIGTESGEGRTLKGVAPERQAARANAGMAVVAAVQKRGIRVVSLGNGLYPSAERAELLGLTREELSRIMFGGIDTDYEALRATGERVRESLAAGKELHITGPSGTDLKVRIAGRPVHVSDGVISAQDRKQGGTALNAWLPAGEVYLTPVAGTAEGVIVADRYFYEGQVIQGLRLELKAGKLTGLTAKSGLEGLRARYDAAGTGKDGFSVVDLGINPSITIPEGKAVNIWSRAGAVTVSVGNNIWAGGDNHADFGIAPEVAGATVTLDGKELVKDGRLVPPPAVAAR